MVGPQPEPEYEFVMHEGKRIRIRKGWNVIGGDELAAVGEAAWKAKLDAIGFKEERPAGFENRGPLKPGEPMPPGALGP